MNWANTADNDSLATSEANPYTHGQVYASHTQINRTTNAEDSIFSQDTAGGYNPIMSIVLAEGKDVAKGMVGYIIIGVDTTAVGNFDW